MVKFNEAGVSYLTWRQGCGQQAFAWRDPKTEEFGLLPLPTPDGRYAAVVPVSESEKHPLIDQNGTMVVLHGTTRTPTPPFPLHGALGGDDWIVRYLNNRYLRLPDDVHVLVDLDSADGEAVRVRGSQYYLDAHSTPATRGQLLLPDATLHWWLLSEET